MEGLDFVFVHEKLPLIFKEGQLIAELAEPLKPKFDAEGSSFKVYNKWVGVSTDQSSIAYLTADNTLLKFLIKDLRNNELKGERFAIKVADFVFDDDQISTLHVDGKGRLNENLTGKEWAKPSIRWTSLLKLDQCWLFVGWDCLAQGNHYVTVSQEGVLKETGFMQSSPETSRQALTQTGQSSIR